MGRKKTITSMIMILVLCSSLPVTNGINSLSNDLGLFPIKNNVNKPFDENSFMTADEYHLQEQHAGLLGRKLLQNRTEEQL